MRAVAEKVSELKKDVGDILSEISEEKLRIIFAEQRIEIKNDLNVISAKEPEPVKIDLRRHMENNGVQSADFIKDNGYENEAHAVRVKQTGARFAFTWEGVQTALNYSCVALVFLSLIFAAVPEIAGVSADFARGGTRAFINHVLILMCASLASVGLFTAVLSWVSEKGVEKEKDKKYLVSIFSSVVSVAAMIVALLSLAR